MHATPRRRPPVFRRLALALAMASLGCAAFGHRFADHPVTVTEIAILSQHGVAPKQIVEKIRRSGTIYKLGDAQYADLRTRGVTPVVIDFMQKSHAEAVQAFPKLAQDEDLSCWSLGFDGFWYAGGPFGLHPDC